MGLCLAYGSGTCDGARREEANLTDAFLRDWSRDNEREPTRNVVAFALVLFAIRFLAANIGYLTEGDEILIAEGVATIANDSVGPIYRYGPQIGYYRLVIHLTGLLGDLSRAPVVMVMISTIAGTVLPTLGLLAFRADLERRERWLVALALAVNPILWVDSQYGNSAIPAAALVCSAFVILSNRPSRRAETAALVLFGTAMLVRADAVLVTGALGMLLWRNHGGVRPALMRVMLLGLAMAGIYGILMLADPRMSGMLQAVGTHRSNVFATMFWDFLLWGMSPFPLLFAIVGVRELEPRRRWLLAIIAAWCIPVFAFYFGNTTTPRYHMLAVLPLTIASAVGAITVVRLFGRGRLAAGVGVLALLFAHAFVAVGRFTPGTRRSWLNEGSIGTHDGEFSTGAFLYKEFRRNPPQLSRQLALRYQLPESLHLWLDELQSGRYAGRHIVVVSDGVYGPLIHWATEFRGLRPVLYTPNGGQDCGDFMFEVSGARVTTTNLPLLRGNPSCRLAMTAGDELWVVRPRGTEGLRLATERLPGGLQLTPTADAPHQNLARHRATGAP